MVNKKRKIEVKDLNEHLICDLCNGYLIDATAITECLHTFCRACIRRQLNIKPICPSCLKKDQNFSPKSSPRLRQDRILQSLIYKIVPGLYQRELASRIKFTQNHSGQDDRILRWSDEIPKDKKALTSPGFSKEEVFSVCLRRQTGYPVNIGEGNTDIQSFLSCPGSVCTGALKKFILMKLGLVKDWQVIFFNGLDSFSDTCTLIDVAHIKRWDKLSPLTLDYYLINPHLNGVQLTKSSRKRPRLEASITESSPTSGIKIRIRLAEVMNDKTRVQETQTTEKNKISEQTNNLPPSVETVKEIKSPMKNKNRISESSEIKNETEIEHDDDFQPSPKRIKVDQTVKTNIANTVDNTATVTTGKDNTSSSQNKNPTPDETDSVSKKKRGRPKRSCHGKLSILSLLKRRWSQEPQIKKEPPASPEKESEEISGSSGQEAITTLLNVSEKEHMEPHRNSGNVIGDDGNTSIVTFREDNQDSTQFSPLKNPETVTQPMAVPIIANSTIQNPPLDTTQTAPDLNKKDGDFVSNIGCNAQMKYPDINMLSQSAELQRLLFLSQQPNLFMSNADLITAYQQKIFELISSQSPCFQKPIEGMLPFQQHPSQIQMGSNMAETSTGFNNEMFAKMPQVPPEYLNSMLYGQQVPQMLLGYPQLPLQPLVIPPGFDCNFMQNILASNQKPGMEAASLTPEQISSLNVPLPYNFVYPSAPTQYVPDCTNYYMGQALHPMGNPFEANQILSKTNFHETPQEDKMSRNKSFLPDDRASSVEHHMANQIDGINGCAERPLFSPMSVDEDDKRVGIIPESALDPSKEIGAEKCEVLLNGSHTSDVSV